MILKRKKKKTDRTLHHCLYVRLFLVLCGFNRIAIEYYLYQLKEATLVS
jgi:hypothetical protein